MKKVRLGVVGCGKRGMYLASLFRQHPQCEVKVLMDSHRRCAEEGAAKLGVADVRIESDYDRLLGEAAVDALLITADPMLQVDLACRAMERGMHACTEVPAAFTIDDCWRLIAAVEKSKCKYQLMEQTRHWGFVDAWTQMRQRGELGHVCLVQGEYVHYEKHWMLWVDPASGEQFGELTPPAGRQVVPTWRMKAFANPIYYLPHTLSPLLKILDDKVVRVSCMGTGLGSYTYPGRQLPVRDLEYALMHTAGDTVMLVGAGFTMPHVQRGELHAHWYEVRGSAGSVSSPRYAGDKFRSWRMGQETYGAVELSAIPLSADAEQAKTGHGGADFMPVDLFLQAIVNDTTPSMDVYRAVDITAPAVLAAESSRRGGVTLDVPDFRAKRG